MCKIKTFGSCVAQPVDAGTIDLYGGGAMRRAHLLEDAKSRTLIKWFHGDEILQLSIFKNV